MFGFLYQTQFVNEGVNNIEEAILNYKRNRSFARLYMIVTSIVLEVNITKDNPELKKNHDDALEYNEEDHLWQVRRLNALMEMVTELLSLISVRLPKLHQTIHFNIQLCFPPFYGFRQDM